MLFPFLIFLQLFQLKCSLSKSLSDFFECPLKFITSDDGSIGVIPYGRVGLSVIPRNYHCSYKFYIPPGFALHLSISTHFELSLGDNITFTDNLGMSAVLPTPNQHIDAWAASLSAILRIDTVTNTSQMFAIYEFVDVEKRFKQVMIPTGDYFALNSMNDRFFTFYSKPGDSVAINIAVKSTQDFDPLLDYIFVYDGGDIKKLSNYLRKPKPSKNQNLTIVNYYNAPSTSFLIGNDFSGSAQDEAAIDRFVSAISKFTKYKAILTSRNQQTTGEFFDSTDQGSAYTWICSDCQHFYWMVLKFDRARTIQQKSLIELIPLSPTHRLSPLLLYKAAESSDLLFPQAIPTKMFTMINHYSGFGITLDTSSHESISKKWLQPVDGRRGVIFSPSSWDPNSSPAFEYNFTNAESRFKFVIQIKQAEIETDPESLSIQTGSVSNSKVDKLKIEKTTTLMENRKESEGNYLHVFFDANNSKSNNHNGSDIPKMK